MNRLIVVSLLAWAAVATTGCGTRGGTLSGKVKFGSRLVTMGKVTVVTKDGTTRHGDIAEDGTYRIENCPGGEIKIAVFSPHPEEAAAIAAQQADMNKPRGGSVSTAAATAPAKIPKEVLQRWVKLPDQYLDPDKSGLTVNVSGDTEFDIIMQ